MNNISSVHISREEMIDYLSVKKITSEFITKTAGYNAHIYKCEECRNLYNEVSEMLEKEKRMARKNLAEKKNEFSSIIEDSITNALSYLNEKADNFSQWIDLQIDNLVLKSNSSFSHPTLSTVLMSTDAEEESPDVLSVLADKQKNRMSIEEDGTFTMYFNSKQLPNGSCVILVSSDPNIVPQKGYVEKYDSENGYVEFYNVVSGEYAILLEKS